MQLGEIIESLSSQLNRVDTMKEWLIDLTVEIAEIPAPPFEEDKRGLFIKKKLATIGYDTMIDKEGNVLAGKDLSNPNPVIISAHLDTVFSLTDIEVRRIDDKLFGPGVGDDSRGLTNLIVIAELLFDTDYVDDILFVATVGEEGIGDLRGVKYLFNSDEHTYQVSAFVTIDGSGTERIVDQGVGSLRYRVQFTGPGGHSWGSYGSVNPLFAMSAFLTKCSNLKLSENPKTTFSAGVIGGGTSINSIPEEVWVDIDCRSESSKELERLDNKVKELASMAIKEENISRDGKITVKFEQVGNRPAGKLPKHSGLREKIEEIHRYLDIGLYFGASSTDANVPLNLEIPAIAVASVENAGRAHTQEEWIDASESGIVTIKRNLILCAYLTQ